ncbi:hypothetical protein FK515_28745, partial [Klebsiella pneumoniae]|nr:hypothetical protein [Klebsiella pneumoniae]
MCGIWEERKKEAMQNGDWQTVLACPVMYQANQQLVSQPLSYDAIKELRRTVKKGGIHSSFTTPLLEAKAESYTLDPHDWKLLMKMVLTPTQSMILKKDVLCKVLQNLNQQIP